MSTENLHTIFHPFVLRVVFLNPDSTANNVWLTVSSVLHLPEALFCLTLFLFFTLPLFFPTMA